MSQALTRPKRLVITGGPGGGKTSVKVFLQMELPKRNWTPIFVPEAATLIIGGGLRPAELNSEQYLEFQDLIFKTQLKFEDDTFRRAAEIKMAGKTVMICDRGLMDNKAYMPPEAFADLLAKNRMTEVDARDRRYDGVLHLVTAADGQPEFYTTKNNPTRTEDVEQAIAVDHRTREAWVGHPHLRVIQSAASFEQKKERLLAQVLRCLGEPSALEVERKFLVCGGSPLCHIPVPFKKILIEQVYLKSPDGGEVRIRRRGQKNCDSVYYETHKAPTDSPASRVETEYQISEDRYISLLRYSGIDYDVIRKDRVCFLWQNQYFELDVIREPNRHLGLTMLEIELLNETDPVEIPPWLGLVTEVTGDPKFSNFALAHR